MPGCDQAAGESSQGPELGLPTTGRAVPVQSCCMHEAHCQRGDAGTGASRHALSTVGTRLMLRAVHTSILLFFELCMRVYPLSRFCGDTTVRARRYSATPLGGAGGLKGPAAADLDQTDWWAGSGPTQTRRGGLGRQATWHREASGIGGGTGSAAEKGRDARSRAVALAGRSHGKQGAHSDDTALGTDDGAVCPG